MVERAREIQVVIFDKTGALTKVAAIPVATGLPVLRGIDLTMRKALFEKHDVFDQGFSFAKPLSPEAISTLLESEDGRIDTAARDRNVA